MPTSASQRVRRWPALWLVSSTMIAGLALGGCSLFQAPGGTPSPGVPTETGSPTVTGSPLEPSGSPTVTGSPLEPSESGSPTVTGSPLAPSGSPTPTGSVAPVSCTEVTPVRVEKVTAEPRRTLEVVTLVSDGRNLTPGTREQTDFLTPSLIAPDGSQNTDQATLQKIASLIAASSRNRVLLTRPDPPDQDADASKRPYNAPGTYVAFSASATLNADVIVNCSGQEQRWQFRAEGDQTIGVVNCAVEPPRSNGVARQVFASNC
jgi:hypothetical protein